LASARQVPGRKTDTRLHHRNKGPPYRRRVLLRSFADRVVYVETVRKRVFQKRLLR
jgi:hypothetical protein